MSTANPDALFSPMLAYSDTPDDLREYAKHLPLLGSYKLDGIRGVNLPSSALCDKRYIASRTLKPLPSKYAQGLALPEYSLYDGEFLIKPGPLGEGETVMGATFSAVMTHGCTTPLDWWLFDYTDIHSSCVHAPLPYTDRLMIVQDMLSDRPHPDIKVLEQRLLETPEQIAAMEKEALDLGYEGLIVRKPNGLYRRGRATWNQGWLMKVVRVLTSEAEVLGFEEMMHNDNIATIDARGYTVRQKLSVNMRASGMLGKFLCRDVKTGVEFKCGNGDGLTHQLREEIWRNQEKYLGRFFKYSHKPYGMKEKPRQPKWLGWRDPMDM